MAFVLFCVHATTMAFRSRRSSFARNLKCLDPDYVDYELDGGCSAADKNQWFFEVGWEVANKGELRPLKIC